MIQRVGAAETHALRHRVLRPHQRLDEMIYPGDDDPETGHFAATDGDTVIGVVTILHQPPGGAPDCRGVHTDNRARLLEVGSWWRLRGMATAEGRRNQGVGSALLAAAQAHVAASGGKALWCNARLPAVAFYQRGGFATVGEAWDEPGLGPHIVMWRAVP